METKRVILAIALSIIVIVAYQYFFMPKPQPRPVPPPGSPETVATESGTPPAQTEKTAAAGDTTTEGQLPDVFSAQKTTETPGPQKTEFEPVKENIKDQDLKEIVVETDLFKAVFTNKGAGLKSFVLKKYNDDVKQPLDLISSKVFEKFGPHEIFPFYFSPFEESEELKAMYLHLNQQQYFYEGDSPVLLVGNQEAKKEVVFKYSDVEKNLSVEKRFTFTNNSYVFGVDCRVTKEGRKLEEAPLIFGPDLENNVNKNRVMQPDLRIGAYNGQDITSLVFSKLKTAEKKGQLLEEAAGTMGNQFHWAAFDTNYFAAVFKTRGQVNYALLKTKTDKKSSEKPKLYSYMIATKLQQVYLGPKDEAILKSVETSDDFMDITKVVDYGWYFIGSIASLMLKGIVLIYGWIPNYGWALVIFTIFIKILLFPLTYASSVSMAKMQTLQPKLKALKNKYKNLRDPEQRRRMNQETMALYKEEKVNPASGCLPLILQMPILFAFFRLLPISINFRHEPWLLWITDLSVKDPVYLLPILMGATQIMVSKMSPTTGDSTQKKLMYIMPVLFVFLFLNYSAGLNLYWFVSNLLQMVQQYYINKKIFKEKKDEDRQERALKRKGRNK